jgi:hypothetical protein
MMNGAIWCAGHCVEFSPLCRGVLSEQIQPFAADGQHAAIHFDQPPNNCRADHTSVTGDKYAATS